MDRKHSLLQKLKDTENMISLTKDVAEHDKDSNSLKVSLASLEKMERRLQSECVELGYGAMIDGVFQLSEEDATSDQPTAT